MRRNSAIRIVTVLSSIALITGAVIGTDAASSFAAARPSPTHVGGFVRIANEVVPQAQRATVLGTRSATAPMSLSIALPNRDAAGLNRLIYNIERGAASPISQEQFASRFGAPKARVDAVAGWARSNGLQVTYRSLDGMTIGANGTTAAVEHALQVRIDNFRLGSRRFYAVNASPIVPARLGIEAIVGLNSYQREYAAGLQPSAFQGGQSLTKLFHSSNHSYTAHPLAFRNGGYFPKDFRAAYDVSQHAGSAAGQTIGFTLWGEPENNSDLAKFALDTGDTKITACATTTSTATPSACTGSHSANTVQWVEVDGTSIEVDALGETALDVESGHGLAPNSHLKYFLGGSNGANGPLSIAVSAAANDKTLHLVSNSWGGQFDGTTNPFTVSTTNSFKHAIAVGTTFFVSSGDQANDSGCPHPALVARTTCNQPSYPADSPYVVAVGGTNLQVNSTATAYSSESVWSNFQRSVSSTNYNVSGGGSGCASYFARPVFQQNVAGVRANATCSGRAEPDVSADADPSSGALEVFTGLNAQKHPVQITEDIGGTSLASPLWTAMAADTDNYLAAHKKSLVGFWAPPIYKLAQTKLYNTYFHDVVCGYNGVPASLGWDQATGWGSPDWYRLTLGLAGTPPASTGTAPTNCQLPATTSVTNAENSMGLPFTHWPSGVVASSESAGRLADSYVDAPCTSSSCPDNFFRQFHGQSYAHFGFKGGLGESAHITIGTDSTPFGYYIASYYPNNDDAANIVNDVVAHAKSAFGLNYFDCSVNLEDNAVLTPDCRADVAIRSGGTDFVFYIFAVNNTVGELLLQVSDATLQANKAAVANDADVLANNEIVQLESATNGFGETFP